MTGRPDPWTDHGVPEGPAYIAEQEALAAAMVNRDLDRYEAEDEAEAGS